MTFFSFERRNQPRSIPSSLGMCLVLNNTHAFESLRHVFSFAWYDANSKGRPGTYN